MGISASKVEKTPPDEDLKFENSISSIEPNFEEEIVVDPRSPTAEIIRTPIRFISQNLEKIRMSEEFVMTPQKAYDVLNVDPRSPTNEFVRSYIVTACSQEKSIKLVNKNLDKVKNSEILTKPKTPSYVHQPGLLETNLDYTETDLDSVMSTSGEDNDIKLEDNALPDVEEDISLVHDKKKELETVEEIAMEAKPEYEITCSSNVEEPAPILSSTIDLTADVKEFDKKLSNLIYEDRDMVVCPKIVQLKDVERSPLRNVNTERRSLQKLKVSNKPRKLEHSKIPIVKQKKFGKVQCENTPPSNYGTTNKKDRWDNANATLYL